jgi:hypothetical protein
MRKEETIEINGKIYGSPKFVTMFPLCSYEEAKAALPYWNKEYAKHGVIFSVKKEETVSQFTGKPIYGLVSWEFEGYARRGGKKK